MNQLDLAGKSQTTTQTVRKKQYLGWLSIISALPYPGLGIILAIVALCLKNHDHTLPKIALVFASAWFLILFVVLAR